MSRYMAKRVKKRTRVAGLMSGTSADGVDMAVVGIAGRHVDWVAFEMLAHKPALRQTPLGRRRYARHGRAPTTRRSYRCCRSSSKAL